MNRIQEVSSVIIAMDEIIGKLNSFFTDSVILKMNYDIQALGSEVEAMTGYSSGEVSGRPFSFICVDSNLHRLIEKEIRPGYFDGIVTNLLNKQNQPVKVYITGFYLGLISDINGYIILKAKLLEDNTFLKKQLVSKKQELDSFIYRTAHDLRGPIATIKGLVNLLKIRKGDHEVDELTSLIEVHANKLDDRLFKLIYIADDNSETRHCNGIVHFPTLSAALQNTLENNFEVSNTEFDFTSSHENVYYINERRLTQLLNHVLLYIIGLPITTIPTEGSFTIAISCEILANKLRIRISTKGFMAGEEVQRILDQPVSLYNDILNYPFLFNYYVAQREARQLHGMLRIEFSRADEQTIFLSIPFDYTMPVKSGQDRKGEFPQGLKNSME